MLIDIVLIVNFFARCFFVSEAKTLSIAEFIGF